MLKLERPCKLKAQWTNSGLSDKFRIHEKLCFVCSASCIHMFCSKAACGVGPKAHWGFCHVYRNMYKCPLDIITWPCHVLSDFDIRRADQVVCRQCAKLLRWWCVIIDDEKKTQAMDNGIEGITLAYIKIYLKLYPKCDIWNIGLRNPAHFWISNESLV